MITKSNVSKPQDMGTEDEKSHRKKCFYQKENIYINNIYLNREKKNLINYGYIYNREMFIQTPEKILKIERKTFAVKKSNLKSRKKKFPKISYQKKIFFYQGRNICYLEK